MDSSTLGFPVWVPKILQHPLYKGPEEGPQLRATQITTNTIMFQTTVLKGFGQFRDVGAVLVVCWFQALEFGV